MLLPSGNPFKCHEEVWPLRPMIPPKRFNIFPLTGGCSEGLHAFRFFFKLGIVLHRKVSRAREADLFNLHTITIVIIIIINSLFVFSPSVMVTRRVFQKYNVVVRIASFFFERLSCKAPLRLANTQSGGPNDLQTKRICTRGTLPQRCSQLSIGQERATHKK